jgi:hypothetical protein
MKINLEENKKKTFPRQPLLVQVMVLFVIFFISVIIGQMVEDLIFRDPLFLLGAAPNIILFFIKDFIFSILWAFAIVYIIDRRKTMSLDISGKRSF